LSKTKIGLGEVAETRQLAEAKLKGLHIIRTTGNLRETLNEKNIQEEDIEEILENDEEAEELDIENAEDTLAQDDIGEEDEDIDYDETKTSNPFDVECIGEIKKGRYVAEVTAVEEPNNGFGYQVRFLQVPLYETDKKADKKLIRDTLFARYRLFYEMASFIAEKQFDYFSNPKGKDPVNLNQTDMVNYLQKNNISKEHASRMLNSLYFKVQGTGYMPSKYVFERYGHKTGMSKDELIELAKKFFEFSAEAQHRDGKFTRLDEAKAFRVFVKKQAGKEIELSDSANEHDRYKNLKNILNKARKSLTLK